jgi:DNA end-binding protein Ku
MAQTIWKGWLSFGLVNIPVRLYRAVEERAVRFREIEKGTGRRVRHRRVVQTPDGANDPQPSRQEEEPSRITNVRPKETPAGSGQEIGYEQVVKGYELPSGEIVALDREDLADLEPEQTRTIEILEFVDLAEIDPVVFDRSYYLVAQDEPGAFRAYGLLLRAMEQSGRVGVGTFVLRTREHLAAIRPLHGALSLVTMHYADEIRFPADVGYVTPAADAPKREVMLAQQLIGVLAASWDPRKHRDSYRERVLQLIEEKAQAGEVMLPLAERREISAPVDLMAALKASVAAIGDKKKVQRPRRGTG